MKQQLNNFKTATKLSIAIVLIAFTTSVHAQQLFKLSGKVTDGKTAVPGASVSIKGTSTGLATDAEGNFSFSLKKGTYTLVVSAISLPKEVSVILTKNTVISIDMADSFVSLNEVLVSTVCLNSNSVI